MNENPYQAPAIIGDAPAPAMDSDERYATSIREAHIKHETSIRTVGIFYYVCGGLLVIACAGAFADVPTQGGADFRQLPIMAVCLGLAGAHILVGYHLRKFKGWARIVAIILSFISLLNLPLGTIFGIIFLIILFSGQNKMVFSPEYQEIIAATPGVKHKTPTVAWILLGLMLLFAGMLVIAFLI